MEPVINNLSIITEKNCAIRFTLQESEISVSLRGQRTFKSGGYTGFKRTGKEKTEGNINVILKTSKSLYSTE